MREGGGGKEQRKEKEEGEGNEVMDGREEGKWLCSNHQQAHGVF